MQHPGILLGTTIKDQGRTQKKFAFLVGKKVSEVNELIKGKRNITIQWDYLLHTILGDPIKYWLQMQIDYEYQQFLATEPESSVSQREIVAKQDIPLEEEEVVDKSVENISMDVSLDAKKDPEELKVSDEQRKEKQQIFRDF
ncbi:MAG: hypothetical protein LBO09_03415 [Candidatus Peribacteria bacterium]|nr:hypothetical protein [Candidatus Peribacteria bacterium]